MSSSSVGHKGQVRGAAQDTGGDAVKEAENTESKEQIVGPKHEAKAESATGRENPLEQKGDDQ